MKSTTDICLIAKAGASLSLPIGSKSTTDLCLIARALSQGATLTLIGSANSKSTSDLCLIAKAGNTNGGHVSFSLIND